MADFPTLFDVAVAELRRACELGVEAHLSTGMAAVVLHHLGLPIQPTARPGTPDDLDQLRRRLEA